MSSRYDGILAESKVDYFGKDGFYWWWGEVENSRDPENAGRVQVRIAGWYTGAKRDFSTKLAQKDLPWATVLQPTNQAGVAGAGEGNNGLQPGAIVMGFFLDGEEAQVPVVMGVMKPKLKDSNKKDGSFPSVFGGLLESKGGADLQLYATQAQDVTNPDKVTGGGSPSPSAVPDDGNSKRVNDAGGVGTALPGSAETNPVMPPIPDNQKPVAEGVGGAWQSYETSVKSKLEDIFITAGELVKREDGSFISIVTGKVIKMEKLLGQMSNLLSSIFSDAVAALKEITTRAIAKALDVARKVLRTGIPLIISTIIASILPAVQRILCGYDNQIFAWLTNPMAQLENLVNSIVGKAFAFLDKLQTAFDSLIANILCQIQKGIDTIKNILSIVTSLISIAKSVGEIYKAGKLVMSLDLEKLDLSSITSLIVTILNLIPVNCGKEPNKSKTTGWMPLLGTSDCDNSSIANLTGGAGAGRGCSGGGLAGFAASIFNDIDQHLVDIKTHLNGAFVQQSNTPGNLSTITKTASGATHTSINYNEKQLAEHQRNLSKIVNSDSARGVGAAKPKGKNIIADHYNFPGSYTKVVAGDKCEHIQGDYICNVDGDYRLKVTGDCHIEIGGGMYVHVSSAPKVKDKNGKSTGAKGQAKSSIFVSGDFDVATKGKLNIQPMGYTVAAEKGTDLKLITDTLNLNTPSFGINCTNDIKLSAGNAIWLETPALYQNINMPGILPRAKSGIFTMCYGPVDTIIMPAIPNAVPMWTLNNTVGGVKINVVAGSMDTNILAGAYNVKVGAGLCNFTVGTNFSVKAGTSISMVASTSISMVAAKISLN